MPKGIYTRSKFSLHTNNQGDPVKVFWSRVDKNGPIHPVLKSRCWLWTGYKLKQGYGQFRSKKTHRLAYVHTKGDIPDGMFVCHKCDNPPCCNPDHLFLGTAQDNMTDKVNKGRQYTGGGPPSPGEKNGNVVLNQEQVNKIKEMHASGKSTNGIIREMNLTVSYSCVRRIITGKLWKGS